MKMVAKRSSKVRPEKWLLNLIQKQCSVPFIPVEVREDMEAMRRNGVYVRPRREMALVLYSASLVTLPTVSL